MQIEITEAQLSLIVAALCAVSPSGGGSAPFTLSCALTEHLPRNHTGSDAFQAEIGYMQRTAYDEYREHAQ